ncbi:MAG: hypothetical protein GY937_25585 [bacterium]|nr:hypothetical protein [bacterium]
MKAKTVAIVLVLSRDEQPSGATGLARRFVSAMPSDDGQVAVPWLDVDVETLGGERNVDFEQSMTAISIRHPPGVLGDVLWVSTLTFLDGGDAGSSLVLSSILGGPAFTRIWSYLVRTADAVTRALKPRCATLGGLLTSDNPAAVLRDEHVPRTFAPWTYVSLEGLGDDVVAGLRGLPDCTIREAANGVVIEAVEDVHSPPTQRFVDALAALPVVPRVTYKDLTFPVPPVR